MSDYLLSHGTRETPQTEQADPRQVVNDADGYVFDIGDFAQLRRWLILGSEGGDYYAGQRQRTVANVAVLDRCIAADGARTVGEIREVSAGGLAPSNEPALYALARCLATGDRDTRLQAGKSLPVVARIGTHLFHFIQYAQTMRGWGPQMRRAVAEWYELRDPADLAYDAIKYRQRDGMSHRDVLRLAHPVSPSDEHREVFGFISGNVGHTNTLDVDHMNREVEPWSQGHETDETDGRIAGYLAAQTAKTATDTARLIREFRLPREAVNTDHLADLEVWRALVDTGMPLHALTRQLSTMTRNGLLADLDYRNKVVARLTDGEQVRRSRLHPLALLVALRTYASGHGERNTWQPISSVIDALDEAFYLAFDNVEPTQGRTLLAIDVSGSMTNRVAGLPISAREGAVLMALVTLHAEPNADVMGFTTRVHPPLGLSARQRLDDALRTVPQTGEGTDVALPITAALEMAPKIGKYDSIVLYTDNQSWAGSTHTHEAVRRYRDEVNADVKVVAVGMTATRFSVLDPADPRCLNVSGFDVSAPSVISAFVGGRL